MNPAASVPRRDVTVVPVLGMHRSGTSMFTRALDLLGMALGQPLMAPQPDNPKGFWENEFFYGVNVRLLRGLGCHPSGYGRAEDLLQVPQLSARIERTPDVLAAIDDYLTAQFLGPVWGWKDPRAVLLFPFWLAALVELGFRRIRPAIITRHPFAVARSMARRADLGLLAGGPERTREEVALEMWLAYTHLLLDIAEETDCFVGVHEWFLDAERAGQELVRCAGYAGLDPDPARLKAALDWLDPSAVHHRAPQPVAAALAEEALVLYEDLVGRARAQRCAWAHRG